MHTLFDFSHWTLGDAAFVAWIVLWVGFAIRNIQVLRLRVMMLRYLAHAAQRDIDAGKPWMWRYEEYERISYDRMLLSIWKPIELFYRQSPARENPYAPEIPQ